MVAVADIASNREKKETLKMSRVIFAVLFIVGIAVLAIGVYVGLGFELKEELYYQPGEEIPSVRTVTIYPQAITGLAITLTGGVLEALASIAAAVSYRGKKKHQYRKYPMTTHKNKFPPFLQGTAQISSFYGPPRTRK